MTILSNYFQPVFLFVFFVLCFFVFCFLFFAQIIVYLLPQILVDAAAGYGLPPCQSFYFFTQGIQTFVLPW